MNEAGEQDLAILEEVAAKVERLERKVDKIKQELEGALKEGELRTQLIALSAPDLVARIPKRFNPSNTVPPSQTRSPRSADRRAVPKAKTSVVRHREIIDWCRTILRENGGEMHISEIRERLESNPEWRVPGRGTDSNVSVHLARSDAFEGGSGRGMWRLADGGRG